MPPRSEPIRYFVRAESASSLDLLGQGRASEIFHPHSDPATVLGDAVHGHDTRMPHAGQGPGFVEKRRPGVPAGGLHRRLEELESHVALECGSQARQTSPRAPVPISSRSVRSPQRSVSLAGSGFDPLGAS